MTTATAVHTDPARRHDFVLLFDVKDGNPNGDPDAGNLPRIDPETMQGLVTDVAIKRKVRDWVDTASREEGVLPAEQGYEIYVQHGAFLGETRKRALEGITAVGERRERMCRTFFDVRMFGAVMSMTENNAGQVRGPVQLTFARSLDPIVPIDHSIVGPAQNAADIRSNQDDPEGRNRGTMGRKSTVPYALYRAHGFFNPHFARQTGASAQDLEVLWRALVNAWDLDRSASRGMMSCRGLIVFSHESSLGNARAQDLFDRVRIRPAEGLETPPRRFEHYVVEVDDADLPSGVTLTRLCL